MEDYLTGHWKARLLVEEGRVQTEFVATLYEDKTNTLLSAQSTMGGSML